MKEFIAYILQFDHLDKQQIDLIKSKSTETGLFKGDYFSEASKMPKFLVTNDLTKTRSVT